MSVPAIELAGTFLSDCESRTRGVQAIDEPTSRLLNKERWARFAGGASRNVHCPILCRAHVGGNLAGQRTTQFAYLFLRKGGMLGADFHSNGSAPVYSIE